MNDTTTSQEKRHPIRVAAARAGLSPEVLRAWELRYGVLEPGRSPSGQRRYSDADVDRLRLLHQATAVGHRIGSVASRSNAELRQLVREEQEEQAFTVSDVASGVVDLLLEECIAATRFFDEPRLRSALGRAVVQLTPDDLLNELVSPLMKRIGEMWANGEIDPGHEHFATAVVRQVLTDLIEAMDIGDETHRLVVTTPVGQVHELGALLAAAAAAVQGWNVTYLGTSLPATSIAMVAAENQARAVALSIVADEDPQLLVEVKSLREWLHRDVQIIVGGAGALERTRDFERAGARVLGSIRELTAELGAMKSIE